MFREEAELSGGPAYGYDALDGPQFAKLLPLLGEDLPPAHVDRLFEQMDVDSSGGIDALELTGASARTRGGDLALQAVEARGAPANVAELIFS